METGLYFLETQRSIPLTMRYNWNSAKRHPMRFLNRIIFSVGMTDRQLPSPLPPAVHREPVSLLSFRSTDTRLCIKPPLYARS
ncbi:MAG: hypothetical protein GY820_28870 [Gammaproteobacteria bacterium]|nr:hypothetical protein [Gammaproteobacteria bacterium]